MEGTMENLDWYPENTAIRFGFDRTELLEGMGNRILQKLGELDTTKDEDQWKRLVSVLRDVCLSHRNMKNIFTYLSQLKAPNSFKAEQVYALLPSVKDQSNNQRLMGIVNELECLEENEMVFKELVTDLTDTCTFKLLPFSFNEYIQNLSADKRKTIEKIRKEVSLVPLD
jgi:hypothetical protein